MWARRALVATIGTASLSGMLWTAVPPAPAGGGGCLHGTPATVGRGTTVEMVAAWPAAGPKLERFDTVERLDLLQHCGSIESGEHRREHPEFHPRPPTISATRTGVQTPPWA